MTQFSTTRRGGTKKPNTWVKPWEVMPKFLRHKMVQVWIQHVDRFQFRHHRCRHVCTVHLIWAHLLFNTHLFCSGSPGKLEPTPACIRRQAEHTLVYHRMNTYRQSHSGSVLRPKWPFCVEFSCSPCACMCFLLGAPFSPHMQIWWTGDSQFPVGVKVSVKQAPKGEIGKVKRGWLHFWEHDHIFKH